MVFAVGIDAGCGLMGLLFQREEAATVLFGYSMVSLLLLIVFFVYVYLLKDIGSYKRIIFSND